jgi:murein DD-endopeptidase MepM/ murein hydrolase activator NlpD
MRIKTGPFIFVLLTVALSGCATAPKTAQKPPKASHPSGFYHKVERGQTLWRIAKTYGIELDELLRTNNISDSNSIDTGQSILIPAKSKPAVAAAFNDEDFIWPLKGRVISRFGSISNSVVNKGINIEPSKTNSVLASRSGKVVFYSDDFLDLGKTLILEHPEGFWTVYARNSDVLVKVGDIVQRATPIAKVGSAGRDKVSYLHFQIRKGSIAQNPNYFLP